MVLSKRRRLTSEDRKIAKKIKSLRVEKGWSQEQLSEMLGKNPNYIAFVESNRRGISLPVLYKVAEIFKIELKELFDKS